MSTRPSYRATPDGKPATQEKGKTRWRYSPRSEVDLAQFINRLRFMAYQEMDCLKIVVCGIGILSSCEDANFIEHACQGVRSRYGPPMHRGLNHYVNDINLSVPIFRHYLKCLSITFRCPNRFLCPVYLDQASVGDS
jgi:hypothetical protein